MMSESRKKQTIGPEDMAARYQSAQHLRQGILRKVCAFNTTLIPHWIGSSDCFWYERESKNGKEYRLVDANEGSNELAFDHSSLAFALEKSSGEVVSAENLPIRKLEFSLSPLQVIFDAFDRRWCFTSQDNHCIEIDTLPQVWAVSPDGKKAAYLRDHNIWMRDLVTGEERALTRDGERFYAYGCAPAAWGMEVSVGVLDALWSPDSTRLLTAQVDTRQVGIEPIMQYVPQDGSLRPKIISAERRVAHSGDTHIDEYRFLAIEVETGKQQEACYRRCPIFRNAIEFFTNAYSWWSSDSRRAYFIDMERGGDHTVRLVEFDTSTGCTRVLIEEENPESCFKLRLDSRNPIHARPLQEKNELLWYSERSGWGHLYLYDLDTGRLKHAITEGEWLVRDIHYYDAESRDLIIQTAGRVEGRDPYYRDVCRVNIDTGELTALVSTDDEYVVLNEHDEIAEHLSATRDTWKCGGVSSTGRYLVATRSRVDDIPVSVLLDRSGRHKMELEVADISGLPQGWQWPERVKLLAADGQTPIYGVVYRPSSFSQGQSYPVIDVSMTTQDGCFFPNGSFTNNASVDSSYYLCAALAELGFIVVDIAGRGTPNRHRAFSASITPELPSSDNQADRIAGIRQLAEQYPYIDIGRVGAGGVAASNVAISGLLGAPDFYKVGVSESPIADLRLLPAFFGEAFSGLSESIDACPSVHSYAENLAGKLLLVHGMLNPAISVATTFGLIEALRKANKDFDLLLLPNDSFPISSYAVRRGWDYFVKHLLGVEPPTEFELITSFDIITGNAPLQE